MDNKRKKERRACLVPIEGKPGSLYENTCTIDICDGGMGLITSKYIPVDEKIFVEIELTPGEKSMLVEAQVKWIFKISQCENYRVGLKFNNTFTEDVREELTSVMS